MASASTPSAGPGQRTGRTVGVIDRVPPVCFFLTSAVFHYLGPSLAVLLFVHVAVLGVAWLRIVSAAVVFTVWRRPWRVFRRLTRGHRWIVGGLGAVLAGMNSLFYLAVDQLPLSTVSSIEFLGPVLLAAVGARTLRNMGALILAVGGAYIVTDVRLAGHSLGFLCAFGNCLGFILYVILGHRIATRSGQRTGGAEGTAVAMSGIDQLGVAMLAAAIVATPFGLMPALPALRNPLWLAWGVGVGVCSSVVPYVTDQLAMARLPRASFALMLSLLPAAGTGIGLLVLAQIPTWRDLLGVGLVVAGVALHRDGSGAQ